MKVSLLDLYGKIIPIANTTYEAVGTSGGGHAHTHLELVLRHGDRVRLGTVVKFCLVGHCFCWKFGLEGICELCW